jgi:hypothetical protein
MSNSVGNDSPGFGGPWAIYFADRRVDFGLATSGSNSSGRALTTGWLGGSTSPAWTKCSSPLTSVAKEEVARGTYLTSMYRRAFAAVTPPPVRQMANRPRCPVGKRFVAPNK